MAINFPDSPSVNDTVTQGDHTWIWDGTTWNLAVDNALSVGGSNTQVQYNSSGSLAGSANFTFDGSILDIGNSAAITPDAYWDGHLTIAGNGYSGGLSLDDTGMWIGHNSASRTIIFATDETERMRITADGEVMLPNVPAFRAYKSGSSTVATTGAAIWVCDSEIFDNGGNFNTSTGKFTAPVDGYYFFTWHMFMHTSYTNDTDTYWGFVATGDNAWFNHGDNGVDGGQSISALFHLDAGDVCYPYIASNLTLTAYTSAKYNAFNGYLVG